MVLRYFVVAGKHTCCFESCRITTKALLNKTNFLNQKHHNAHPLTALKIIQRTFLSDVRILPFCGIFSFLYTYKYTRASLQIYPGFLIVHTHTQIHTHNYTLISS